MINYREGDASCFDNLYERHKGPLYRYLLRQVNHPETCHELFQDIWLNIINARHRYQASAKFTTYLYRVAHNRLVDYWRSHQSDSVSEVDEQLPDGQSQPEQATEQHQLKQQLKQQIARLPADQRHTFLLKEESGLSLAQIAEVTGVNRETVKSRLRYAVQRLKEVFS